MYGDKIRYWPLDFCSSACTSSTCTCSKSVTSRCSYFVVQTIHQDKILKPTLNTLNKLIKLLSLDSYWKISETSKQCNFMQNKPMNEQIMQLLI